MYKNVSLILNIFLEGWVDVGFFYLQDSDTSNRATLNYTVHACIQREVISVH